MKRPADGMNLQTVLNETKGNGKTKRAYDRPQAVRDKLFFPSNDKVRVCVMTVFLLKRRLYQPQR